MEVLSVAGASAQAAFESSSTSVDMKTLPRWKRKAMQRAALGTNTPSRSSRVLKNETPKQARGDRFIPNRVEMDMDAYHKEDIKEDHQNAVEQDEPNADARSYRRKLNERMLPEAKILHFKASAPAPKAGHQNRLKILYTASRQAAPAAGPRRPTRHIPKEAERTLDLPNLNGDYYLNLLDWSVKDVVTVGLENEVYCWHASTGEIVRLLESAEPVCSVHCSQDGKYVGVGLNDGDVQVWDTETQKKLRSMRGHSGRVGALAWNNAVLSSGSADGLIFSHDVRLPNHLIGTLQGHSDEICGLKWNADGTQLASGANDNLVNVYNDTTTPTPAFTFSAHLAATRALSWCPWQKNLLASGGGTQDRTIRFWNTESGACLNSIETGSQVTALQWSQNDREIVSAHGYSSNSLIVWKYPSLVQAAELSGHQNRVLHLAMSPDGTRVASAAADETMRFWNVFSSKEKSAKKHQGRTGAMERMMIR